MGKITALILVVLLSVENVEAGLQTQLATQNPDRHTTMDSCVAAVRSGAFRYYVPSFLTGNKPLVAGEVTRKLEERACVEMFIVGGYRFVPQPIDTEFVFIGDRIIRRWDCGNAVRQIMYVPPTRNVVETGVTIIDRSPPPAPPVVVQETRPVAPIQVPQYPPINISNTNTATIPELKYPEHKGGWGTGRTAAVLGAIGAAIGLCIWKCRGGGTNITVINNPSPSVVTSGQPPVVITLPPTAGPTTTTTPPTGGSLPPCTHLPSC